MREAIVFHQPAARLPLTAPRFDLRWTVCAILTACGLGAYLYALSSFAIGLWTIAVATG